MYLLRNIILVNRGTCMCAILSKLQQNEEINEKPSLQNKSCVFIYIFMYMYNVCVECETRN